MDAGCRLTSARLLYVGLSHQFEFGWLEVWIETRAQDVCAVEALARFYEPAQTKEQVGHVEPEVKLHCVGHKEAKVAIFPAVDNELCHKEALVEVCTETLCGLITHGAIEHV